MVIGVNTRFLIKDHLEGIGWFCFETLKRITQDHPEHQFVFFFDRPFDASFLFSSNVEGVVVGPPARHPILWYLWFEWQLPKKLKEYQVDVFLSPDGYASLSSKVPTLSVIHDLAFEYNAFGVYRSAIWYYKYFTPRYAKKVDRIATVSEFSKSDIVKQYQIDSNKVDVVYDGANDCFKPLSEDEILAVKKEYTNELDYFVYVGSIHPRKNVLVLLQAFEAFKEQAESEHKLVIIGRFAWSNSDLEDYLKTMSFRADVIFLGNQDQPTIARVIAGAVALTYVSVFEGFGIPVLEAMYCNVPSICSNTTSIPEVCGNAGILVNPQSVQEISTAMERMLNPATRSDLVKKCQVQKEKYSWDLTARKLWESLTKIATNTLTSER